MINKVILIGNVGMDPEIRTLESGVKMARLRIATTERLYNREAQEAREHTEWHTVVLWRNLADVADRFVRKGSQVYIEGRLRSREWTDQQGAKRTTVEILADDMKMLGRRSDNNGGQSGGQHYGGGAAPQGGYGSGYGAGAASAPGTPAPAAPEDDVNNDPDDLPF